MLWLCACSALAGSAAGVEVASDATQGALYAAQYSLDVSLAHQRLAGDEAVLHTQAFRGVVSVLNLRRTASQHAAAAFQVPAHHAEWWALLVQSFAPVDAATGVALHQELQNADDWPREDMAQPVYFQWHANGTIGQVVWPHASVTPEEVRELPSPLLQRASLGHPILVRRSCP